MLVPRYWAEHRIQLHEGRGPQTTIRRWGWSGSSQAEADQHARERAEAVAAEVRAGKKLSLAERRERKVAYNGADGLPIREEILQDFPDLDAVITRNQYGARCLNVREVMFADIDVTVGQSNTIGGWIGLFIMSVGVCSSLKNWWWIAVPIFAVVIWRRLAHSARIRRQRKLLLSPDWIAAKIDEWCANHSSWSLHLYRTPAGYRLLGTHALFDPTSEDIIEFFRFFAVDPQFVQMCRKQRCFRARLTGKPWRMGVKDRMGWGTWPPTSTKATDRRREWTGKYEKIATGYSACRYLMHRGSGVEHPRAAAIRRIHDEACRAISDLPLA